MASVSNTIAHHQPNHPWHKSAPPKAAAATPVKPKKETNPPTRYQSPLDPLRHPPQAHDRYARTDPKKCGHRTRATNHVVVSTMEAKGWNESR